MYSIISHIAWFYQISDTDLCPCGNVPHCQILSWMAAYLDYTLRMKTLFRGWPVIWFMTRIWEEEDWLYLFICLAAICHNNKYVIRCRSYIIVCVCICSGSMFHIAALDDIPQSAACSADLDNVRPRLLLCDESACATVHGPVLFSPSFYIASDQHPWSLDAWQSVFCPPFVGTEIYCKVSRSGKIVAGREVDKSVTVYRNSDI